MRLMILIEKLGEFRDVLARGFFGHLVVRGVYILRTILLREYFVGGCESALAFSVGYYGLFGS